MSANGRVYHQDYIARIRYSNTLPPPPIPPKLLDIPNSGLATGQYLSGGFASRLVREQPLNIEADAELGMPIDLVGLAGVLQGDDSVLFAPDKPVSLHPDDKALLRPLSTLGKPSSATNGVSFLRRTEYMTSAGGWSGHGSGLRDVSRRAGVGTTPAAAAAAAATAAEEESRLRKQQDAEKNDPINMLRSIIKGFDIAHPHDAYSGPDTLQNLRGREASAAERRAWDQPTHPSKSSTAVTLVDAYPLLPDLEAIPDAGGYIVTRFQTNPVAGAMAAASNSTTTTPTTTTAYDERLDVGLLRVLEPTPEQDAAYRTSLAKHEAQGTQPPPARNYDYEFFLPTAAASTSSSSRKEAPATTARALKRAFRMTLDDDDHAAATPERADGFRFDRVRCYETVHQIGNAHDPYDTVVALTLNDGAGRLATGAYYHPVLQRTSIRPKRPTRSGAAAYHDEQDRIDVLEVEVRDLDESELADRQAARDRLEAEAEADGVEAV